MFNICTWYSVTYYAYNQFSSNRYDISIDQGEYEELKHNFKKSYNILLLIYDDNLPLYK